MKDLRKKSLSKNKPASGGNFQVGCRFSMLTFIVDGKKGDEVQGAEFVYIDGCTFGVCITGLVVSNLVHFHHCLGKISNLTNSFQRG